MKTTLLRILCALLPLLIATAAIGDNAAGADRDGRLRIGLALGGGGARGAAHIGVLQELERLRIPIDAIAGTSMGAIVGGLYASGMSPDELADLVSSLDWADAFVDQSKRVNRRYRRKQDDSTYTIPLELGMRDGSLRLPKGLIQGQKLSLILRENLMPVYTTDDFDKLPTPFRAVASDIETGEAYIMSQGDLELALRASMSAPGVFSPVVMNGRTLVDGGLVGNVPVSVVREMDVDIVIAVDVEFPLYSPEQLQSALAITEQMLTILIRKETRRELAGLGEDDYLIRPALGEYSSTNFSDIAETIEPGVAATAAFATELGALSVSEEEYARHQQARRSVRQAAPTLDFVRIVDDGRVAGKLLQSQIKTKTGETADAARLAADAEYLFGLGSYEQVTYKLVSEQDRSGVEFQTRTKSWGPNYLRFGVSLEDDFEGSTSINLAARLTHTGINRNAAEWRTDIQVGSDHGFETEFYQPLSRGSRFFVAPSFLLSQGNINAFSGSSSIARYRIGEIEAALDVGRELGRWGEFRLGAFRGGGNARLKTGDPELPNFEFDAGGIHASLAIDGFDDAQVPKSGLKAGLDWRLSRPGMGADSDFDTVEAVIDRAYSWNRNTLRFGLEYQTTLRSNSQIQNYFPLGGFLRLSGLERGEIAGPHAGLSRVMYYRQMDDTGGGVFDLPLYVGGSIEAGNVWQTRSDISFSSLQVNGSVFAGLDTYIGPLFLAAGFAENGDTSFYLFLGAPVQR